MSELPANMRRMVLTGRRSLSVCDAPVPSLRAPGDVLIRVLCVGVCGSDVHYYVDGRIGSQVIQPPFTVGHEGAGVVAAVGAAVKRVRPGDRVAIEPAVHCGRCDQCRAGRPHTCRNLRFLGCPGQIEGCLCDYLVLPEANCHLLPDGLSFEAGAFSEPLAIGVYAVRQSIPLAGAAIGVLGCGPIGLSVLLAARAHGPRALYASDPLAPRRAAATACGATWTGSPAAGDLVEQITGAEPLLLDAVFECCGEQAALDQAVALLKPGGKLMLIGIPALDRVSFDIDHLRRKELTVQNVRRQNGCVAAALELLASGQVPLERLVTHRFSLERVGEAFELAAEYRDGVVKAMVVSNTEH